MGIAEKINPGFAYFDKPWLLALFVAPLTLAGGVGLLLFFQTSCTTVCTLDESDAYTLTRINEAITLWRDIIKPPCNERDCSFASFEADFCIHSARNFIIRNTAVGQEISEGICQMASDEKMAGAGYGEQQYEHPDSGGSVSVSGFHWCDGDWERENGFYTTRNPTPPGCGSSIDGTTVTDPVTGEYVSGNSVTFNLHYHYRRETCNAVCPTVFEAFSDANANLKYIELIVTAIIALILVPTGIIKAKSEVFKKDATVGSVIRSADGMMVNLLELKATVDELKRRTGMDEETPSKAAPTKAPPQKIAPKAVDTPAATSSTIAAAPVVEMSDMSFTVPVGGGPGATLAVTGPDGNKYNITVPDGVQAGQVFTVKLPAAPNAGSLKA